MNENPSVATLYADPKCCSVIKNYLKVRNLIGLCHLQESKNSGIMKLHFHDQEKVYSTPVRLGEILDQATRYKNNATKQSANIHFVGGKLDTHQGVFTHKLGDSINLTEKEVEILAFLHANKGNVISREALLSAVWNYADSVETHTLETHIYRLRQKIERNPAEPEILVTEDSGYSVRSADEI